MAKRARGSRPGQRGRLVRRTTPRPAPSTPRPTDPDDELELATAEVSSTTGLSRSEEAQAAALEARIVAEERAAEASRGKAARTRAEADPSFRSRSRESGMLAVRTAEEVVVVKRDLRRIAVIDGGLVAILFGIWFVALATGFLRL